MSEPFKTVQSPARSVYEEKRSRFIAEIWPTPAKDDGSTRLASLREQYSDARHICWAYFLLDPGGARTAGFNDDGEPNGTAGKPMLNVLMQRRVTNVFAFVIRYFGGIKLGAGGLARAYGQAVSAALDCAQVIDVVPVICLSIEVDYAQEERVRHCLMQYGIQNIQVHYLANAILQCRCTASVADPIIVDITARTSGLARCQKLHTTAGDAC